MFGSNKFAGHFSLATWYASCFVKFVVSLLPMQHEQRCRLKKLQIVILHINWWLVVSHQNYACCVGYITQVECREHVYSYTYTVKSWKVINTSIKVENLVKYIKRNISVYILKSPSILFQQKKCNILIPRLLCVCVYKN